VLRANRTNSRKAGLPNLGIRCAVFLNNLFRLEK